MAKQAKGQKFGRCERSPSHKKYQSRLDMNGVHPNKLRKMRKHLKLHPNDVSGASLYDNLNHLRKNAKPAFPFIDERDLTTIRRVADVREDWRKLPQYEVVDVKTGQRLEHSPFFSQAQKAFDKASTQVVMQRRETTG